MILKVTFTERHRCNECTSKLVMLHGDLWANPTALSCFSYMHNNILFITILHVSSRHASPYFCDDTSPAPNPPATLGGPGWHLGNFSGPHRQTAPHVHRQFRRMPGGPAQQSAEQSFAALEVEEAARL